MEWGGWETDVQEVAVELVFAVQSVSRDIRQGSIPETFDGTDVATIREQSRSLFTLRDFVPNDLQTLILTTLDGVAMTQFQLMTELDIGSKETFNGKRGKGGMRELIERGLVVNDRRIGGYYRPDAKPP
jgi:hypothetical protein